MKLFLRTTILLLACLVVATHALAADFTWVATPDGYVDDVNAWDNGLNVPGDAADDKAMIKNGGTALVDDLHQFGASPLVSLIVGNGDGTAGSGRIIQTGGTVTTAGSVFVGDAAGTSSYTVTAGTLNMGGWSAIGFADGAVRASSGVMTVGETGNTAVPTITAPNFFVGFNG
ncbi:MAG: hypothetical protein GX621_09525, partial [Pirellulaceae bacterium]|nr:hypothetical protein [Pirellulaceae bacterium]